MIVIKKNETVMFFPEVNSINDVCRDYQVFKPDSNYTNLRLKSYRLSLLDHPEIKEKIYNIVLSREIQDGFQSTFNGDLDDFNLYDDDCGGKEIVEDLFQFCKDNGVHEFNAPYPDEQSTIVSVLESHTSFYDYREHKHHPSLEPSDERFHEEEIDSSIIH